MLVRPSRVAYIARVISLSVASFQDECVISSLVDLDRVRETLVHGRDVEKTSTWRNDRERRVGLAAEEQPACVLTRRFALPLSLRVDS